MRGSFWARYPNLSWAGGPIVAVVLGVILMLFLTGAREVGQQPPHGQGRGICLQEVVVFKDADSLGIVWSAPPCFDNIDLRIPQHWALVIAKTIQIPNKCAMVFRLPGYDAPVVDTMSSSPACTGFDRGPALPIFNGRSATPVHE